MRGTEGRAFPSVGYEWTVRDCDLTGDVPTYGAGYRLRPEDAQKDAAELLAVNSGAIAIVQAVARTCDAQIQQDKWNGEIEIIGVRFNKGVKWTAGTSLTLIAKLLAARRSRPKPTFTRRSPSR